MAMSSTGIMDGTGGGGFDLFSHPRYFFLKSVVLPFSAAPKKMAKSVVPRIFNHMKMKLSNVLKLLNENVVNPFQHGFTNNVHMVLAHQEDNNSFADFSKNFMLVRKKEAPQWLIRVSLFGPAWTEQEMELAEKNKIWLAPGASEKDAFLARDELMRKMSKLLPLRSK